MSKGSRAAMIAAKNRIRSANRGRGRNAKQLISYAIGSKPVMYKLRHRLTGNITSSAGGVISQLVKCNDPTACSDWSNLSGLYDLYVVRSVTLQFFPHITQSSLITTPLPYSPLYVTYDPDSNAQIGTVDEALQYDNCRVKNMYKPWTYKVKYNQFTTSNAVNNAGMALTYVSKVGPMQDIAGASYSDRGIIQYYGDGLQPSVDYGDLVVTYKILFKTRR